MPFPTKFGIILPLLLSAVPHPASAALIVFNGTMSGANSVPTNGSTATGSYTVTVDDVANSVAVSLTFSGLTGGNASAAHIHCCVPSNVNGPVVIPFSGFPSATSGTYSNTFAGVSAANILGIKQGLAYINIHDATFPGGEIRGQITGSVPEPAAWAMLFAGFALVGSMMRSDKRKHKVRAAF